MDQPRLRPAPPPAGSRLPVLDALRGFATCGILVINIFVMGWPRSHSHPPLPVGWRIDWVAYLVQQLFFEGAMRGLFTLLFGAGMMLMLRDDPGADARARSQVFLTRCFGLMLLGLVDVCGFLWFGDILFVYGVCGLVLILFRRADTRLLFTAAATLAAISSLSIATLAMPPVLTQQDAIHAEQVQAAGGTLTKADADAIAARDRALDDHKPDPAADRQETWRRTHFPAAQVWTVHLWSRIFLNGGVLPLANAMESLDFMLAGAALFRAGVLTATRSGRFYAWMAGLGLGVGIAIRGVFLGLRWRTGFAQDPGLQLADELLYEVQRSAVTLGDLGLLVLLLRSRRLGVLTTPLQAIGRLALTNYLGQSLLAFTLFNVFGFFGKLSFLAMLGACAAVWVGQAVFSLTWLSRWEMGPLEWLLRSLAYGALHPLPRPPKGVSGPVRLAE